MGDLRGISANVSLHDVGAISSVTRQAWQDNTPTVSVSNWEEPNAQPGLDNNEPGRREWKRKPRRERPEVPHVINWQSAEELEKEAKEIGVTVRLPMIHAADSKMWRPNSNGAKKSPRSRQQIGPGGNDGAPGDKISQPHNPDRRIRMLCDEFQRLTAKDGPQRRSCFAASRYRRAEHRTPFSFRRRWPRAFRLRLPGPHPSGHPRAVQGNPTSHLGAGTLHSRALDVGSNSSSTPPSNHWGNTTSVWRASVGGTP